MRIDTKIGYAVLGVGTALLAAQAVPMNWLVQEVSAQSGNLSIWEDKSIPPAVAAIVKRSCGDCHSNTTRWPWYGKVAPVSWMLAKDVREARSNLNLSEWLDPKKPYGTAAEAAEICVTVSHGEMPLPRYLMLHPGARLSADEKRTLCQWSERLLQSRGR